MLLYVSFLLKTFVRTAKIIPNESFKDKDSSIAMQIIVAWFCRVHLQVYSSLESLILSTFLWIRQLNSAKMRFPRPLYAISYIHYSQSERKGFRNVD